MPAPRKEKHLQRAPERRKGGQSIGAYSDSTYEALVGSSGGACR